MALLGTYEAERRPFAQELIAFDRWFAEGFSAAAREEAAQSGTTLKLANPLEYAFPSSPASSAPRSHRFLGPSAPSARSRQG